MGSAWLANRVVAGVQRTLAALLPKAGNPFVIDIFCILIYFLYSEMQQYRYVSVYKEEQI